MKKVILQPAGTGRHRPLIARLSKLAEWYLYQASCPLTQLPEMMAEGAEAQSPPVLGEYKAYPGRGRAGYGEYCEDNRFSGRHVLVR